MGTTLTDETEVLSQCCLKHSEETLCEHDWWVAKRNAYKKKKKKEEVQANHFLNVTQSF